MRSSLQSESDRAGFRRILKHVVDRLVCRPHVAWHSSAGGYLMEQGDVILDLSQVDLRPLVKYRLRNGFLQYEQAEQRYISSYLPSEGDVIDLGAGIGFTACVAAREREADCHIVAVEANQALLDAIEQNTRLNGVVNLKTVNAAYESQGNPVSFRVHSDFRSSEIDSPSDARTSHTDSAAGTLITVDGLNLETIVDRFDIGRFSLIVDIEGSESDMILDEIDLLESCCSVMIVEFHEGTNGYEAALETLEPSTFDLVDESDSHNVRVYENTTF